MRLRSTMFAFYACFAVACGASNKDSSMYLTGTEEYAIQLADGSFVCESPEKVLICHIPPGNPDNAQTICVGAAAVAPHEQLHGDFKGACNAPDAGIASDAGAAADAGPVDDGGGEPEADASGEPEADASGEPEADAGLDGGL